MRQAIFIFLLITFAARPALSQGIASLEADLDGDGRKEQISIDKESVGLSLSIARKGRVLWRGVPARWKPWKLSLADVDGDGRLEVIVGVYKATRFFPKPHNCLFIYSWDGERGHPKWLGSSLSKPFVDFAFVDADKGAGQRLAAIEIKRDGRRCLALYSWNGFGFTLDWQRGDWQEAKLVEAAQSRVVIEADGSRLTLTRDEMRNNL